MASTNKTTNYNLSQYIGSDKPTYLGDYNADMLKIDNAMHQNSLDIATADEKATLAGTNANTALTNAGTAQTTADTANTTANSALSKATINEAKITNLETLAEFSTTEKEIGTWIDGKPLYRKVFQYLIPTGSGSTSLTFNTNITNGNLVFLENGLVVNTDYSSPIVFPIFNKNFSEIIIDKDSLRITRTTMTAFGGCTVYAIVNYTKTTD